MSKLSSVDLYFSPSRMGFYYVIYKHSYNMFNLDKISKLPDDAEYINSNDLYSKPCLVRTKNFEEWILFISKDGILISIGQSKNFSTNDIICGLASFSLPDISKYNLGDSILHPMKLPPFDSKIENTLLELLNKNMPISGIPQLKI